MIDELLGDFALVEGPDKTHLQIAEMKSPSSFTNRADSPQCWMAMYEVANSGCRQTAPNREGWCWCQLTFAR